MKDRITEDIPNQHCAVVPNILVPTSWPTKCEVFLHWNDSDRSEWRLFAGLDPHLCLPYPKKVL